VCSLNRPIYTDVRCNLTLAVFLTLRLYPSESDQHPHFSSNTSFKPQRSLKFFIGVTSKVLQNFCIIVIGVLRLNICGAVACDRLRSEASPGQAHFLAAGRAKQRAGPPAARYSMPCPACFHPPRVLMISSAECRLKKSTNCLKVTMYCTLNGVMQRMIPWRLIMTVERKAICTAL
jgi:hypothetical protein